jgi:hypothetical protein
MCIAPAFRCNSLAARPQRRYDPGMSTTRRVLGALVAGAWLLTACAPRERMEVLYFYSAVCPACEESRRSQEGVSSLAFLAGKKRRVDLHYYDVYHDGGAQDALLAALDKYRIPLERQGLPMLIVNGTATVGLEEVEAAIRELSARRR